MIMLISFNQSQRMHKNKEIVLEHPFHPLDLSPHDLLAIYKRFEQSRLINRNPKQQLPIQSVAQLISSLKGCPPSYIQKCISQALIKQTISWNEFLTFLDQESEVRQKILEWLMHEKTTIKYKEERQWPFRSKISKFYEQITFFKFIQLSQSQKLILCSTDKIEYYLFTYHNGKINKIDTFCNKSSKVMLQKNNINKQEQMIINKSIRIFKNQSKLHQKKNPSAQVSKSLYKNDRVQKDKLISSLMSNSSNRVIEASQLRDQDQIFYRKERKNINSLFNVFKDLEINSSINFARIVSQKLHQRNLHPNHVAQIKEAFVGLQEKVQPQKKNEHDNSSIHHIQKAKMLLGQLHRQKRVLTYNPYQTVKHFDKRNIQELKFRKVQKQRKQRQYKNQASQQVYNDKLKCMAIIYYNMQLVLIKISREFNKTALQQQDRIQISAENEHNKNEIIEAIDFYYHSIVNKWFLIILIRVQYKNQARNVNQSYVRGYQIELIDRKGRGDKDITFKKSKKEAFSMMIQKSNGFEEVTKYQIFKMEMQLQYGIHFISVNGKYICYKQDFMEIIPQNSSALLQYNKQNGIQHRYFSFYHEQKFKNSGLSLSCLSISQQLNKIAFGTIRGALIIYDMFSHSFKIKKVCNTQITLIKLLNNLAYILTIDEKLIIYDMIKVEETQHLNIKNQSKLHQKIKNFDINKNNLYFYGTQVRSYSQYVDEKIFHQKRMMQTIYKWRLDKLFKEESSFTKANKYKNKQIPALMPLQSSQKTKSLKKQQTNAIELVITSENYFLILTEILQLIIVDKKTLKIKFTMILGIPHDSKVMKMSFSMNQKLLAILLFNQNVYVFNIYTQDLYQNIKPSPFLKYNTLCFLDIKNQFMLANGTENGKIVLSPYNVIPEKSSKILQFHKKAICSLIVAKKQYLVASSQDNSITIWVLPFNILKHQIKLQASIGFMIDEIGCFKQFVYLRSIEGTIIQINIRQGKLIKNIKQPINWTIAAMDTCTGQLIGINKNLHLQMLAKGKDKWSISRRQKIQTSKAEIKSIGIIESQKIILFYDNGLILPWFYQHQSFGKSMNLCQQ